MHAHFALFCRSTLNSAHNIFCRAPFLFFSLGHALMMPTYYFYFLSSCQVYVLALWILLLLLCWPLTDIHCSNFISRLLMLAAIPILRCSIPARCLPITALCRCSLLISRFLLVFTRYTLLIATHMRSRQKKKGRPTRQLKILKNSKTKKSTQCRQRKKNKVSFNKKSISFKKEKVDRLSANFKKSKKMVCKKTSWPQVGHNHLGDFRVCVLIALLATRMQSSVKAISELRAAYSSSCLSFFLLFFAACRFIHALSSSLLSFCCRRLVCRSSLFFLFIAFLAPRFSFSPFFVVRLLLL